MFSFLSRFEHKREMRESKDEILIGELVLAMTQLNYVVIGFHAGDDRQTVRFKPKSDAVLHSVFVILDRKTGDGAVTQALFGSKATVTLQAEIKNFLADPDDLLHMYQTDLQNMFKLPIVGGVKLNHQLNSVLATLTQIIEIDDYILKGQESNDRLRKLLATTISGLREKLQPYKKA